MNRVLIKQSNTFFLGTKLPSSNLYTVNDIHLILKGDSVFWIILTQNQDKIKVLDKNMGTEDKGVKTVTILGKLGRLVTLLSNVVLDKSIEKGSLFH